MLDSQSSAGRAVGRAADMKSGQHKSYKSLAPGIDAVHGCYGRRFSFATYKVLTLVITFWCYCLFHATRKPPSVVKRWVKEGVLTRSGKACVESAKQPLDSSAD